MTWHHHTVAVDFASYIVSVSVFTLGNMQHPMWSSLAVVLLLSDSVGCMSRGRLLQTLVVMWLFELLMFIVATSAQSYNKTFSLFFTVLMRRTVCMPKSFELLTCWLNIWCTYLLPLTKDITTLTAYFHDNHQWLRHKIFVLNSKITAPMCFPHQKTRWGNT